MNPKDWFAVCNLDDIPRRGAVRISHGNKTIALFRSTDNDLHAIDDACPHKGGPLSDGIMHGNCVTCPLHNWQIDLSTGLALGADEGGVTTYPVRVDGSAVVYIQLSKVAVSAA